MSQPNKAIFDAVCDAITKDALMVKAIVMKTGICDPTVRKVIRCLHENGIVHITSWEAVRLGKEIRYRHIPRYKFGTGVDAEKPPTQTYEERLAAKRLYRAQNKDPAIDAAHRARIREELARPAFRDPFIAALFGPYEARA